MISAPRTFGGVAPAQCAVADRSVGVAKGRGGYAPLFSLTGHAEPITSLDFRPADPHGTSDSGIDSELCGMDLCATADAAGLVTIWDLAVRARLLHFHATPGAGEGPPSAILSAMRAVLRVAFVPVEGALLVATQGRDRLVRVWEVSEAGDAEAPPPTSSTVTGLDGQRFHVAQVLTTAVDQHGFCPMALAAAPTGFSLWTPCDAEGTVDAVMAACGSGVWAVASRVRYPLVQHTCGQMMCLAVGGSAAPRGPPALLVAGFESGHVAVFDLVNKSLAYFSRVCADPVTAACLAGPDGGALVAASAEGSLRAVHWREDRPLWEQPHPRGIGALEACGPLLLCGGWDGPVRLLDVHNGAVCSCLTQHAPAPGTRRQENAVAAAFFPCGPTPPSFAFALTTNLPPEERRRRAGATVFGSGGADGSLSLWRVEWA